MALPRQRPATGPTTSYGRSQECPRRSQPCGDEFPGPRRSDRRRPAERSSMNQLVRVQNFTVSSDGFGTGEGQSLERPFGHVDPGLLFSWARATASWHMRTAPGGSRGLDDYLMRDYARNIGAEIIGRNKFGP